MATCLILAVVFQAMLLQTAYTQCLNQVLPNLLPIEAYMPMEGYLPNQVLVSQPGVALQGYPNTQYPYMPSLAAVEPVSYAPAVVQDSSVANSLANALQLLVVSNLLSTTLPSNCDRAYYPDTYIPGPVGPYGYMY